MQKTKEIYKKWYWRIWTHGTYLDLWSIPHTLFGVITAYLALGLAIDFFSMYLITFIIAFLWELWEMSRNIVEPWQNRGFDVITSILGFIFVFEFQWGVNYLDIASLLTVLWSFFNLWGWVAWRNRVKP